MKEANALHLKKVLLDSRDEFLIDWKVRYEWIAPKTTAPPDTPSSPKDHGNYACSVDQLAVLREEMRQLTIRVRYLEEGLIGIFPQTFGKPDAR